MYPNDYKIQHKHHKSEASQASKDGGSLQAGFQGWVLSLWREGIKGRLLEELAPGMLLQALRSWRERRTDSQMKGGQEYKYSGRKVHEHRGGAWEQTPCGVTTDTRDSRTCQPEAQSQRLSPGKGRAPPHISQQGHNQDGTGLLEPQWSNLRTGLHSVPATLWSHTEWKRDTREGAVKFYKS